MVHPLEVPYALSHEESRTGRGLPACLLHPQFGNASHVISIQDPGSGGIGTGDDLPEPNYILPR